MPVNQIEKYGALWPAKCDPIEIEMGCIRAGGRWMQRGKECGLGLFHHYRELQTLLWPDDDHHRWSDLSLKTIVSNEITVLMGSADSGKTYGIARYILADWWTFPHNTLWLVSSTELRGAELRIWGTLKQLFNRARERHDWLPGYILESWHSITTETVSEDQSEGRLLTKGLIFIPCKQGGRYVGMGAMVGVKPTKNGRLGHAGDEVSVMQPSFLDAYSNWYGKTNFKGIMSGNPFDVTDPLCVAAEPVDGWDSFVDTQKTQFWRSKFYDAAVVAFDGRDSPNLDVPEGKKTPYPYLIGRKKLKAVEKTHGLDSWQYYNQCVGKPRPGTLQNRVITRQLCEDRGAFSAPIWSGKPTTKIGGCDAAYGSIGGDRCVAGYIEFGEDVDGKSILAVHPPVIVPVSVRKERRPEDQIAEFCRDYFQRLEIPASDFYYDATGRGSLGPALARIWSPLINPIEFGGAPTPRPVSADTYIWDGDVQRKRLQRCDEHYSKFVTELWFSVAYLIEAGQLRGLPQDVAFEGFHREWKLVKGNKIEVEPKGEMKERTKQSPDLFDWLVTCVEGARQKGFQIGTVVNQEAVDAGRNWLEDLRQQVRTVRKGRELVYR